MLSIQNLRKINDKKITPELIIYAAIELNDKYMISIIYKKEYPKDILITLYRNLVPVEIFPHNCYKIKFDGWKGNMPQSVEKYILHDCLNTDELFCEFIKCVVEVEF
jgi:hypothetical protein